MGWHYTGTMLACSLIISPIYGPHKRAMRFCVARANVCHAQTDDTLSNEHIDAAPTRNGDTGPASLRCAPVNLLADNMRAV